MIPSAPDKEDAYSVLIPLKEKPVIHRVSDPSSLTIIPLASHNSPFNSSSARAHGVRMKQTKPNTPRMSMWTVNIITNGMGKEVWGVGRCICGMGVWRIPRWIDPCFLNPLQICLKHSFWITPSKGIKLHENHTQEVMIGAVGTDDTKF